MADRRPGKRACQAMARTCLSVNLRKTERLVTRHYDEYLAPAGITAVQLPILANIAVFNGITFRRLAEELDLDRSTLSRNLAVLQRMALVQHEASSGPNAGAISLTHKGQRTLERAERLWSEAHRALQESLPAGAMSGGLEFLKLLRQRTRSATTPAATGRARASSTP